MMRWLRWLVTRARIEREMCDEMRAHVEHRAEDLVRAGVPREEALRRARIEFGAFEAYKEQCRDASGFLPLRPLHGLWGDLKLAARRLAAAPVFTLFAVQRMILRQGFRPVLQGMVLGLFLGVVCRFGIRATVEAPIAIVDPIAFTLIPVVLAGAAYGACWLPARRAASVEPNEALRHV
jgi:hypothetical protein